MNCIVDVYEVSDAYLILEVKDIKGESHYLNVDIEDYRAYQEGEYIQKAFPYLTPGQRELILTGITPEMWDSMFGE
jgi:hypothetical protein